MKLATLNVEGDTHLGLVETFVEREQPDVLCLQEVFESTLPVFAGMGYTCEFLPMAEKIRAGEPTPWGIAVCARRTIRDRREYYYRHAVFPEESTTWKELQKRGVTKNDFKNGLLGVRILFEGSEYMICTTHFTWTRNGETPSAEQISSMDALLAFIPQLGAHILCGDFNIPRAQNELYERLAQVYTDTIPHEYTSSLDKTLHRLGADASKQHLFSSFMVDYILARPPYQVSDVRLVFGVSDHAAVVGHVTKNTPDDVS